MSQAHPAKSKRARSTKHAPGQEGGATTSDSAPAQSSSDFLIRTLGMPIDDDRRVLKHGDTFGVFDRYGDIFLVGNRVEGGLFHEGTRHLDRWALVLSGARPVLLGSEVDEDNVLLTVDLTNPDLRSTNGNAHWSMRSGVLHLHRSKVLYRGTCIEKLKLSNFDIEPLTVEVELFFDADFRDIFEVRGTLREQRGTLLKPEVQADAVTLCYMGLDNVKRCTRIEASDKPDRIQEHSFKYTVTLAPAEHRELTFSVQCVLESARRVVSSFQKAEQEQRDVIRTYNEHVCQIHTANEQFTTWMWRSYSDLFMMATPTEYGIYPYAGVPWYSTVFGRDGIITALQCLWVAPEVAKGVLGFLAAHQAEHDDPENDAEPGKILHEMRKGEMVAMNEIPFGQYYGSIDSTPLFLMLAAAYFRRTADRQFIEELWPAIDKALLWIEHHGDMDHDGFVEYARRRSNGLLNQGWKDSFDSIFHADGTDPEPPIALCEVQAYVYAALRGIAYVAEALGKHTESAKLRMRATTLRDRFEERFWLEDLQTYAVALDAHKKPCRVSTSNAGHVLYGGIASAEHARKVAQRLLSQEHFTGWGIRTLSDQAPRYNPLSYHNGSIWPHDNAMIAAGFARYGLRQEANKVLAAIFDVSLFMDNYRLPELFCGFARRHAHGPTHYPVACSPQAWASGAALMLLEATLALRIDAVNRLLIVDRPALPPFLEGVTLRNLRLGAGTVDLEFHRYPDDVSVRVLRKDCDCEIRVLK